MPLPESFASRGACAPATSEWGVAFCGEVAADSIPVRRLGLKLTELSGAEAEPSLEDEPLAEGANAR
jgi:hypothetical protein